MNKQLTEEELNILRSTIINELGNKPPTVALIGVSGVGKSSTINTLFKTDLAISHTIACTKKFEKIDLNLKFVDENTKDLQTKFRVIDAPGLGEDIRKDPEYISIYKKNLPACDVILWIMNARNRAIALDQQYLNELKEFQGKMVFGINQVDLIEPMNWNTKINLPSQEQIDNINIIVNDRKERLQDVLGREISIIPYSAKVRYNLQELFLHIINSCSEDRRWIFNGLRNFKYDDFLPEDIRNEVIKHIQKKEKKKNNFLNKILNKKHD